MEVRTTQTIRVFPPLLARNASAVISGIRLLQRLMECSPSAIYWGYLEERAEKLRMNFYTAEDWRRVGTSLTLQGSSP